jgi:copper chaperone CopZ
MKGTEMDTYTYTVVGMTCEHCVRAVTGEIEGLPGVVGVRVDLASGVVAIASRNPLADAEVGGAIEKAGYRLAETGTGGAP